MCTFHMSNKATRWLSKRGDVINLHTVMIILVFFHSETSISGALNNLVSWNIAGKEQRWCKAYLFTSLISNQRDGHLFTESCSSFIIRDYVPMVSWYQSGAIHSLQPKKTFWLKQSIMLLKFNKLYNLKANHLPIFFLV